jgi:photosystem II stability/assembly factor-like uncharacterized protein
MRRTFPARLVLAAVLTALCSVPALSAVSVGHSGWNWSNPQPQGRSLNDITAVDATHAYAVGEFGTMLTTADAGETWTGLPTGTTQFLTRVTASGASTFAISGACLVLRSEDGGATLRRLPFTSSDACGNPVQAVAFPTPTLGLILLSDGTLFATSDGGLSFSRRTPIPGASVGASPASDLAMLSSTVGLAATFAGSLFRTSDGGITWSSVLSAPGGLRSLTFADATTAYAVGNGSAVYKSTDVGATWTKLAVATPGVSSTNLARIRCANADVCLLGTDGPQLVRTGDGGATFSTVTPGSQPVNAFALLSPTRAIAVGMAGTTAVSDDAGLTWRQITRSLSTRIVGVRTNSDGFIYAWGPKGTLATSSDRGTTWREPGVATQNAVRAVSFATPEVGYALDQARVLFRTDNGGSSWKILGSEPGFVPSDIFAVSPDKLVLLGDAGSLRRSTDGGQTFTIAGTAVVRPIAQRGERVGSAVVLYGQKAIAISTDAGAKWRIVNGPTAGRARLSMRTAQCPGILTCWAVTTSNKMYRTTNGGTKWTDLSAGVGNGRVASLRFINRRTGYAVMAGTFDATNQLFGSWVLRTVDGGATWNPQLVTNSSPLQVASGAGVNVALDDTGNIFTTTTGGARTTPSVLTLTTKTRVARAGTKVLLTGRLTPSRGGEHIAISTSDGRTRAVTAGSDGRFSTTLLVAKTTTFVAQWGGDAARDGDGSPVLSVRRR